eukprot:20578-Heterococcus_DN1.PRE.1
MHTLRTVILLQRQHLHERSGNVSCPEPVSIRRARAVVHTFNVTIMIISSDHNSARWMLPVVVTAASSGTGSSGSATVVVVVASVDQADQCSLCCVVAVPVVAATHRADAAKCRLFDSTQHTAVMFRSDTMLTCAVPQQGQAHN